MTDTPQFYVTGGSSSVRLVDPGGSGWPEPPKVSKAEVALYGDMAEITRLLGQAHQAAGDAFSLASKAFGENPACASPSEEDTFQRETLKVLYEQYERSRDVHLDVAAAAISRTRRHRSSDPADGEQNAA